MAEHDTTKTSGDCWPTKRDMLGLGYTWGYLQATVDHSKMQKSAPSSGGWIQALLSKIKASVEGYELAQKIWALRRPAGLTFLIASWWEQLLWLLRLIAG